MRLDHYATNRSLMSSISNTVEAPDMSLDLIVRISVALFLVHEFEEIIFIRAWLDRHQDDPRVSRQAFWSFRDTSTATIAALIFEE